MASLCLKFLTYDLDQKVQGNTLCTCRWTYDALLPMYLDSFNVIHEVSWHSECYILVIIQLVQLIPIFCTESGGFADTCAPADCQTCRRHCMLHIHTCIHTHIHSYNISNCSGIICDSIKTCFTELPIVGILGCVYIHIQIVTHSHASKPLVITKARTHLHTPPSGAG